MRLFMVIFLLWSCHTQAAHYIIGHNLTPTTDTLPSGGVTIGTYLAAYGLTDHITVGTSTWMDISYNMPNLGARLRLPTIFEGQQVTLETIYFKTSPYLENLYDQTSIFARLTHGVDFSAEWSSYLSFGYQKFWEDRLPYSLRGEPQGADPRTISLSTLQKLCKTDYFCWMFEVGVLGINYPIRYTHAGASINYHDEHWMLQFGFSGSKSQRPIPITASPATHLVFHPEIQIQYGF